MYCFYCTHLIINIHTVLKKDIKTQTSAVNVVTDVSQHLIEQTLMPFSIAVFVLLVLLILCVWIGGWGGISHSDSRILQFKYFILINMFFLFCSR